MPIPKGTTNVRIPDFPHTYMGEPYSGEEKVRKDEKMYIYFGYFSPGHSIYCVFTKEEIPINYFRLKKTKNHSGNTEITKPAIVLPNEGPMYGPGKKGSSTHYQVYNLNTKNDWWWRGDGKKTLILCNPFSTPAVSVVHDFLKDHDLDMKNIVNIGMLDDKLRNDVLPLKDSSKETHVSVIQEKTSGDPVFISDYIKKNNMRFLKHETVNTEIYIKPYSKEEENVDCPVIIKGSNLPKIKLDKEFNYVGKIYFQPFPKRDHGDDIE